MSRRRKLHLIHPDQLGLICGAKATANTEPKVTTDPRRATCKTCRDFVARNRQLFYVGVLLVALLAACGGEDRDACEEVGAALCARSSECELLDPARVEWCIDEYRRGCADRSPDDDQADACVDALAGFDCDALAAGASPAECER